MSSPLALNVAVLSLLLLCTDLPDRRALAAAAGGDADVPSRAEMWAIIQAQQAQIAALKEAVNSTRQQTQVTVERLDITGDYLERLESRAAPERGTTLGGYGELHYNNLDADESVNDTKEIDFHRFVLFFNHEFTDRIRFFSEFELEHALVADTADGSGPGEAELEQAFVEIDLDARHHLRTGLFLLTHGILNETHEPPTFYGVERNGVENVIIPSTWWESGVGMRGHYQNGLSWDAAVHSGLAIPTSGGSAFRVRSGRQKSAQAIADNLAFSARLRYTGIRGLDLSATYNYQSDPSQTGGDGLDDGRLLNLNAVFNRGPFAIRGVWAQWKFSGNAVEAAGAEKQTGWYVEPSYRFTLAEHAVGAYARYEDVDGVRTQDQFDQWELGVNYYPVADVVMKFDYRSRDHGPTAAAGRDFKGFDLGVGYQF